MSQPITITIGNTLTLRGLPLRATEALHAALDFDYTQRVWARGKIRFESSRWPVVTAAPDGHEVYLPYGTLLEAVRVLRKMALPLTFARTTALYPRDGFPALLQDRDDREGQREVLAAVRAYVEEAHHYGCCLTAPCGAGKTWMACRLIDEFRQPTLIVVHTVELLRQWCRVLEEAFGITPATIKNGKGKPGAVFTVGLVQTLRRVAHSYADAWGMAIFDECHHVPAATFHQVADVLNATVKVGLTATATRSDGLRPLLTATLGPIVARVDQHALYRSGDALPARVRPIRTGWTWQDDRDPARFHTQMVGDLILDPLRNALVASEIARCVRAGRRVLALSSRLAHLDLLGAELRWEGVPTQIITGDTPTEERAAAMDRLQAGFDGVTLATDTLAKEGLDAPPLDTLAWCVPVRNEVLVQQAAGRIQRAHPGKKPPLILDFRDDDFPGPKEAKAWPDADSQRLLFWQWYARRAVYRRIGIQIDGA